MRVYNPWTYIQKYKYLYRTVFSSLSEHCVTLQALLTEREIMFDFLILEVQDRPITIIDVNLVVCF